MCLADVEEATLNEAVQDLKSQALDVLGVVTDVSKADSVGELCRRTLETYGKVHILCNNAGVVGEAPLIWESEKNDWEWIFGVNFWGVVHGIAAFLPIMIGQDEEGHVVNTASIAGLAIGGGIYGASKHAVVSVSESLYLQLGAMNSKVKVSVLCPGFVSTRIFDAARNRPTNLQPARGLDPAENPDQYNQLKALFESGLPPRDVAEMVVEAIREERLYILTTREFDGDIRDSVEYILERRNPDLNVNRDKAEDIVKRRIPDFFGS